MKGLMVPFVRFLSSCQVASGYCPGILFGGRTSFWGGGTSGHAMTPTRIGPSEFFGF